MFAAGTREPGALGDAGSAHGACEGSRSPEVHIQRFLPEAGKTWARGPREMVPNFPASLDGPGGPYPSARLRQEHWVAQRFIASGRNDPREGYSNGKGELRNLCAHSHGA